MLTAAERRWRLAAVVLVCFGVIGLIASLQPWLPSPLHPKLWMATGLAGVAGGFIARSRLSDLVYGSRVILRDAQYLVCPDCYHNLGGAPRNIEGITQCTECGYQDSRDGIRERWRDAYAIHLDAWGGVERDELEEIERRRW